MFFKLKALSNFKSLKLFIVRLFYKSDCVENISFEFSIVSYGIL